MIPLSVNPEAILALDTFASEYSSFATEARVTEERALEAGNERVAKAAEKLKYLARDISRTVPELAEKLRAFDEACSEWNALGEVRRGAA